MVLVRRKIYFLYVWLLYAANVYLTAYYHSTLILCNITVYCHYTLLLYIIITITTLLHLSLSLCSYTTTLVFITGEKYLGQWCRDTKQGPALQITLDGSYMEGTFHNNKLIVSGVTCISNYNY